MKARIARWSQHPSAQVILFVLALIESCLFPLPPVALLAPMAFFNPHLIWRYGALCYAGSLLGSLVGYGIGSFAFEFAGRQLLDHLGYRDTFESFAASFREFGWWIIFVKGVTPFPFQVATIFSGSTQLNWITFLSAVCLSRAARYALVCAGLLLIIRLWHRAPD